MSSVRGWVLAAVTCATLVTFALAGDKEPAPAGKAKEMFGRMLKLAGDWEGTAGMGEDKHPAKLNLRSSAGGSVLVETEFCGSDREMMTMIYLDKGELVLTHYCHLANQPHMKGKIISDKEILFEFAGGSNIDPKTSQHMHEARYQFIDDDHFTSTWTLYDQGKETMKAKMEMARSKQ